MTFDELFTAATGSSAPYDYQRCFAEGADLPDVLIVPTGAGKTATAVLGWLFRRRFHPTIQVRRATPRRLVYCLPMRTLCEQTHRCVDSWLSRLGLLNTGNQHSSSRGVGATQRPVNLHLLMGGEDGGDWKTSPTEDSVLIGTQDMLLSRALNRGYGASRFAWPMEFGLLNNDCAWVFDEPQLMANGLGTSAQLAGLRERLCTEGPCHSLWMSATLEPHWLRTIDFSRELRVRRPTFPDLEAAASPPDRILRARLHASKTLRAATGIDARNEREVAGYVRQVHQRGSQTLVIVNTVERARRLTDELRGGKNKAANSAEVLLLHSRFRASERRVLQRQLIEDSPAADRIIVSTQVVEAGMDISCRNLVTELAPWSNLVQRMGRCNRAGYESDSTVHWVDLPSTQAAPYHADDLDLARMILGECEGGSVSPHHLQIVSDRHPQRAPYREANTLRKRDLLDLFDTTPDLSGSDVDVQRFVRGDDPETDVLVFWRNLGQSGNPTAPHGDELCPVPIGELKKHLKTGNNRSAARIWDHLEGKWNAIRDPEREVRPGQSICLDLNVGGYSDLGWDGKSTAPVAVLQVPQEEQLEGTADDPLSSQSCAIGLEEHTQHVCDELEALLQELGISQQWQSVLQTAALWHDIGKAHEVFQAGLRLVNPSLDPTRLWAKSGSRKRLSYNRHCFRHECASALAALQGGVPFAAAYLIASHHGRMRLSIRALPVEHESLDPAVNHRLFALGIYDGDRLPEMAILGRNLPAATLSLAPMQLGGGASWTDQALTLLETWGPFRLAWFEAILRVADQIASAKEVLP